MLNATSDFFDMIICLTYLHLFSRKVAIKNSWNKIDIFMFIFLCFPHAMQFWRSFPRRKETQYMSKKDRESFCCVPLQKPGQVWTLSNVCHWEKVTLVKAATHPRVSALPFAEEVTYRWIYNEFPVFLHTDRRRLVSQKTGNFYISKVEAQDAGNYSCFVSSPMIGKSVFSKFIPLIPLPPDDG